VAGTRSGPLLKLFVKLLHPILCSCYTTRTTSWSLVSPLCGRAGGQRCEKCWMQQRLAKAALRHVEARARLSRLVHPRSNAAGIDGYCAEFSDCLSLL